MDVTLRVMHSRRGAFRRPILVTAAVLTGALLGILPAAAASATTATFQRGTVGSYPIHTVTFVVTNDTSAPIQNWRVDFDLPADTWPAPWPSPHVQIAIVPTETGRHITVRKAANNPYPIPPGGSYQFTLPMSGSAAPANCLVDGTVPCTDVTP